MLTIFSVPKPFEGHVGRIQRNAIGSWTRLQPACQVVLCGDEPGTSEVAEELGVERVPDVTRNRFGTPLLSSVFRAAEERARFGLLCYVNADIVLLSDFVEAAARVAAAKRRFLMVGRRCNLDLTEEILFDEGLWEATLRRRVQEAGELHSPDGIDYFVYPRGAIGPLPAFAVGRPGWDNWMIYRARKRRVPVVDATAAVLAVHQNHGHDHVKQATGTRWEGPEADANRALMGSDDFLFTLLDATHRIAPDGIERNLGGRGLRRRLHAGLILGPAVLRSASLPLRQRLRARARARLDDPGR